MSLPSLEDIRAARLRDVEALDPGIRRLVNPHIYHVSLSEKLWNLKAGVDRGGAQGEYWVGVR